MMIQIDERIQRISRIGTDFFIFLSKIKHWISKNPYQSVKSVESVHLFVSSLKISLLSHFQQICYLCGRQKNS
ncbi:MAG: hypothetical protein RLZZ628_4351 [Bacteroidota bacterium]